MNFIAGWQHVHPKSKASRSLRNIFLVPGTFSMKKPFGPLAKDYPTFVHGLGLSLGTPGDLCDLTLSKFARVAEIADAQWVSEHISFSKTENVDLGHLNPISFNDLSLKCMIDHAIEVSERCRRPLILENITSSLRVKSDFSETEFLNRLCDGSDCGLLLDVTNLFINSKNHHFDPEKWVHEIEPRRIKQLHVVGYSERNGVFHDHHSTRIQDDLMDLVRWVVDYSKVDAVTLERDNRLDETDEIQAELQRLEGLCAPS